MATDQKMSKYLRTRGPAKPPEPKCRECADTGVALVWHDGQVVATATCTNCDAAKH